MIAEAEVAGKETMTNANTNTNTKQGRSSPEGESGQCTSNQLAEEDWGFDGAFGDDDNDDNGGEEDPFAEIDCDDDFFKVIHYIFILLGDVFLLFIQYLTISAHTRMLQHVRAHRASCSLVSIMIAKIHPQPRRQRVGDVISI